MGTHEVAAAHWVEDCGPCQDRLGGVAGLSIFWAITAEWDTRCKTSLRFSLMSVANGTQFLGAKAFAQ